jgi:hypothetical protein
MAKLESQASYCNSCCHFDFCQVNWGPGCKRQGGKKIPRLKSIAVEAKQTISKTKMVSKNTEKPKKYEKPVKPERKIVEKFEPIRTKVVCW